MAIQSQPSRIPEPFAGSGTKNVIPATNSTPSASQAASWASGFPPECSQPISAGGCPVPRNDMNGALNWISQDFAFRQDGGIWAWSALADYDTGRFVRGSDNNFYRASAQSGPGTSAGAKDPTADDGTHWSKMPSMADIVAQNFATQNWVTSQNYATQTWVHDIGIAPIYVDASAPAGGDGLSAATAFNNFADAIVLSKNLNQRQGKIIVAGGTYAGNAYINQINCELSLQGDVTISGTLTVTEHSNIFVNGNSYELTVSSGVDVLDRSSVNFNNLNLLTVNSSGRSAFTVYGNSCVYINSKFSFTASSASSVVFVSSSYVSIEGSHNSDVHGTSISYAAVSVSSGFFLINHIVNIDASAVNGVTAEAGSFAIFYGKVVVGDTITTGIGIFSNSSSCVILAGGSDVCSGYDAVSGVGAIVAAGSSYLVLSGGSSVTHVIRVKKSSSHGLLSVGNSAIEVYGKLVIGAATGTGYAAVGANEGGYIMFPQDYSHEIWDYWSSCVFSCVMNSCIFIDNNVSFSGNATGKKFSVRWGGQIASRVSEADLPGDSNGTNDTATFGYFRYY